MRLTSSNNDRYSERKKSNSLKSHKKLFRKKKAHSTHGRFARIHDNALATLQANGFGDTRTELSIRAWQYCLARFCTMIQTIIGIIYFVHIHHLKTNLAKALLAPHI